MKKLTALLIITLILFLCHVNAVLAQGAGKYTAQLKPEHLKKLAATKMKIVIPAYIPRGFTLSDVTTRDNKRFGYEYHIIYQGPDGATFQVEGCDGGIGDVIPDGEYSTFKFNNPVFGKGELYWHKAAGDTADRMESQWLFSKSKTGHPTYMIYGKKIPSEDAVKIVESLRYLEK